MAVSTKHIVQPYRKEGKRLAVDRPREFGTAESAKSAAQLTATKTAGVVAYSATGELEEGIIDETVILYGFGRVPGEMQENA
jgi:hypothetical protein